MKCPRCNVELTSHLHRRGLTYSCPTCQGRLVGMSVFRKHAGPELAGAFWEVVISRGPTTEVHSPPCGICRRPMTPVSLPTSQAIQIDICQPCQFFWFDRDELESIPPAPVSGKPEPTRKMAVTGAVESIHVPGWKTEVVTETGSAAVTEIVCEGIALLVNLLSP